MPRAQKSASKPKHDPLHIQLDEDSLHAKYGNVSQPGKRKKARRDKSDRESEDETTLDPKTSKKIFELALDQQEESEEDDFGALDVTTFDRTAPRPTKQIDEDDDEDDEGMAPFDDEDIDLDAELELQVDPDDMKTMDALLPTNQVERRTLADMIFSKLNEVGAGQKVVIKVGRDPDLPPDPAAGINPQVVDLYSKVGQVLSRYKSGPLPKPFKIIPTLPAWARILALTHPENWSPQGCYAATRMFISMMKPPQARVFLEGVLLDAIREDIRLTKEGSRKTKNHRKLNVHYYESLKRAIYKPAAFFKGIVFPLLQTGCTLQEAAIVASVLAKVKVPLLHSAAALLKLAEMDYSGPNSLFIRILLDKKYALPYKVVDGLVFHFIRLSNQYKPRSSGEARDLPVLWHQSLLVFCQRYASDLTPDQKDALLDVVRVQSHPQISQEVRRELVNSVARGEARMEDGDGDVAMGA
ncbi:cell adhesion protein byn-1 [Thelephora terrestris]|uniref:Cell adhesion protein byn-1 n=1 Tax=Thelephora terrestris TaxID=56493 RepID=A0A9P6H4X9_9AGAM|nr:cell adhesion protein byn-1 [Thelephora terrestris]